MLQTLLPAAPYDFQLSTLVFGQGDPVIRRAEGSRFWQVIRIRDMLVLACVTSTGDTEHPALSLVLRGGSDLTRKEGEEGARIITRILNLHEDLAPFYRSVAGDLPMADLVRRLRGLKAPTTPTLFEALVDSVIEQQISLRVARVLEARLVKKFGDPMLVDGTTYYAFPTPGDLSSGTTEQFRSCGLSVRKGEYIRDAAQQFAEGKIDPGELQGREDTGTIIRALSELRGVGRWTAELAILRGLHRMDAVPADDLGLRRAISSRYCDGRKITGEEARKVAARFGPYAGLASFYLLVADQMEI